jgi:hypothetical protein
MVEPLPAGNAVRVFMAPPSTAKQWALLRKLTNDISGIADPGAFTVYRGSQLQVVLDTDPQLVNGTAYFYEEFDSTDAVNFTPSPSMSATPATTALDAGADVLSIVRERLALYLAAAVSAGTLQPQSGAIAVLTAPPLFEDTRWPVVTVHLRSEAAEIRGIGEDIAADVFDSIGNTWLESEGALDRVDLQVIAWSQNPDERIALRMALKAGIKANLPVFDDAGMDLIQWSFTDIEDFESYSSPVYQTVCSFSCIAPTIVSDTVAPIADANDTATAFFDTSTVQHAGIN